VLISRARLGSPDTSAPTTTITILKSGYSSAGGQPASTASRTTATAQQVSINGSSKLLTVDPFDHHRPLRPSCSAARLLLPLALLLRINTWCLLRVLVRKRLSVLVLALLLMVVMLMLRGGLEVIQDVRAINRHHSIRLLLLLLRIVKIRMLR